MHSNARSLAVDDAFLPHRPPMRHVWGSQDEGHGAVGDLFTTTMGREVRGQ